MDLRQIDTFGNVAAEDDPILDYFLTTSTVGQIRTSTPLLVLGAKGSGKTALVRYFTEQSHPDLLCAAIRMTDYPWGVHAQRRDAAAAEANAFGAAWEFLLAVEYAKIVIRAAGDEDSDESLRIRKFLKDNYGTESGSPKEILRPESLTMSGSIEPKMFGFSLFRIDFKRPPNDMRLGAELNAASEALFSNAQAIASRNLKGKKVLLHIDELDHGLSDLDKPRSDMLIGLVLAASDIARKFEKVESPFSPVVYLRDDLWNALSFSDKNKIRQTRTHVLTWSEDELRKMIEERATAKLGTTTRFEDIEDGATMRGTQRKWSHIAARTKMRPRDAIKFVNCVHAQVCSRLTGPWIITNEDIGRSRQAYSQYFKAELDDEIVPHWPRWDFSMAAIAADAKLTFERSAFETAYVARSTDGVTADQALERLFQFSVIGYRQPKGGGGSRWVFRHLDPAAPWDPGARFFKVHLGLKEYYQLREDRLPSGLAVSGDAPHFDDFDETDLDALLAGTHDDTTARK